MSLCDVAVKTVYFVEKEKEKKTVIKLFRTFFTNRKRDEKQIQHAMKH